MNAALSSLVYGWSSTKARIENLLPIDNVFIHIAVGMAIYWLATRIFRGRRAPLFAWAAALLATVANEIIDLLVERWPSLGEQLWEGTTDLFWTLALPSVALLLSRSPRPLLYSDSEATDQPA
jgi:hypothetical protein